MAGDKFDIKVSSWYKTNGVAPGAAVNPLADLLSALTNGVGNLPGSKSTPTQLQQAAVFTPGATVFLNSQPAPGTKPKAYLNWVLFDEQFKLVQSSSGAELVRADNTFTNHLKQNLPVNRNGYLYIYVSNTTPNIDVFFDNLQVTHNRGALLEESHYYPFGLLMAGISSKSAGKLENKKKFVGQELDSEFDLNWYQFKWRNHDPQIGRFIQIDPLASDYVYNSTYAYAENKPINGIDLEGLEWMEKITSGSNGEKYKNWTLTAKVLDNKSGLTNEELKTFAQEIKAYAEKTFKGTDAEGYNVTTTVNLEFSDYSDVSFSKDYILEINDGNFRGGKTLDDMAGQTREIGNTETNFIEMASPKALKSDNPKYFTTEEKAVIGASQGATHEFGHSGGLKHKSDPSNPGNVKKSMEKHNLMNERIFIDKPAALSPQQLSEISNNIKNKQ